MDGYIIFKEQKNHSTNQKKDSPLPLGVDFLIDTMVFLVGVRSDLPDLLLHGSRSNQDCQG
ncbi:MAG: hypothetical protein LBH21_08535, partial [Gracilibacteraceae bacterium]|nr:hypothetical protein [Gracilibacteraceae bacterium]